MARSVCSACTEGHCVEPADQLLNRVDRIGQVVVAGCRIERDFITTASCVSCRMSVRIPVIGEPGVVTQDHLIGAGANVVSDDCSVGCYLCSVAISKIALNRSRIVSRLGERSTAKIARLDRCVGQCALSQRCVTGITPSIGVILRVIVVSQAAERAVVAGNSRVIEVDRCRCVDPLDPGNVRPSNSAFLASADCGCRGRRDMDRYPDDFWVTADPVRIQHDRHGVAGVDNTHIPKRHRLHGRVA